MRVRSLLLAAVVVAGALVASEAQAEPGRATGNVNLRQCASTRCARIVTIPRGAVVEVLGREGAWFRVEYRRVVGYAYASYIDARGYVAPPLPPPVYYPEPYLMSTSRSRMSTSRSRSRARTAHTGCGSTTAATTIAATTRWGHDQGQDQGSGGFPHEGGSYHLPHDGNWPPYRDGSAPAPNQTVAPLPTLPAPQGSPPLGAPLQLPQQFQHLHQGGVHCAPGVPICQ